MGNHLTSMRSCLLTCLRRNLDIDEEDSLDGSGTSVSINCACFHSKAVKQHHEEKSQQIAAAAGDEKRKQKKEKRVRFKV